MLFCIQSSVWVGYDMKDYSYVTQAYLCRQLRGTMRVVMKPLIGVMPLMGGVTVFFLNNPVSYLVTQNMVEMRPPRVNIKRCSECLPRWLYPVRSIFQFVEMTEYTWMFWNAQFSFVHIHSVSWHPIVHYTYSNIIQYCNKVYWVNVSTALFVSLCNHLTLIKALWL